MQPQTHSPLTTVFSDVLSDLAFMFTDDEPAEPSPGSLWLEGTIRYQGPVSGELRVLCPMEFTRLLAANLLGIDADDAEAEARSPDALREFLNVLCGQFVTAAYGHDKVFDLSIPQARVLSETPTELGRDDDDARVFNVEGHCVQLIHRQDTGEHATQH